MKTTKMIVDEYLEELWGMKEKEEDTTEALKNALGDQYDPEILDFMISDGMISLDSVESKVSLTGKGSSRAKQVIRAHRLAERLLYDAMGVRDNIETVACEFEHIVAEEMVNGICTLLGHPKECPHGHPIPPGDCCIKSATTIESSVIRLTDMQVGQAARIAYIDCSEDEDLHRLDGLQIKPGVKIRLHQTYPAYVVECEGANIALDDEIAQNICLWRSQKKGGVSSGSPAPVSEDRKRPWMGGMFSRKRKNACLPDSPGVS